MKILFLQEIHLGGGAKSNTNLAICASQIGEVYLLGINNPPNLNENIQIINSNARRGVSIRYLLAFWKALNTLKPEIVHATGMYTGFLSFLFRTIRRNKFKTVMTLRHTSNRFRLHFLATRLVRMLNKTDAVHYLTNYQRNQYLKFGLNPAVFHIIPNIVNVHYYPESRIKELRKNLLETTGSEKLITCIGRLDPPKQNDVFIKTISELNKKGYDVGGVMVGDGDESYTKELKELAVQLGLEKKVHFAGYSEEPEAYIKAGDFGVFPTMHPEGLPRLIVETFSQGKTLVVSNHPSILDVVENNVDTLITSPHEVEEYVKNCSKLIENPDLLKKLENGAIKKYNKSYEAEFVRGVYRKMYEELLKN